MLPSRLHFPRVLDEIFLVLEVKDRLACGIIEARSLCIRTMVMGALLRCAQPVPLRHAILESVGVAFALNPQPEKLQKNN